MLGPSPLSGRTVGVIHTAAVKPAGLHRETCACSWTQLCLVLFVQDIRFPVLQGDRVVLVESWMWVLRHCLVTVPSKILQNCPKC